ncbi:MAG: M48 family metalloprotease [Candidatus Eisenbacteria bacterium]|nr:M48 family metalloprotease [Candidatus Eisenbacteria bacterium]
MRRTVFIGFLAVVGAAALLIAGCTATDLGKIGTSIAANQGYISDDQKGAIDRTGEAFRKSFEELTEEEEYYIGRAVAATLLGRYPLYKNDEVTGYVNRVGRAVALYSSRPEIYGGWHFAVLDVDEVNAFAAPGGTILITRGMLAILPDEDALACVLAHEVGHVAGRHGLAAIQKSRLIDAFAILGREAGTAWNKEELVKLTDLFDGAVGDVVRTLVERGYSRSQEKEADRMAVEFASAVGYRADGITRFLERMDESGSGGAGMFATHPPAKDRIRDVEPVVKSRLAEGTDPSARTERFKRSTRSIG